MGGIADVNEAPDNYWRQYDKATAPSLVDQLYEPGDVGKLGPELQQKLFTDDLRARQRAADPAAYRQGAQPRPGPLAPAGTLDAPIGSVMKPALDLYLPNDASPLNAGLAVATGPVGGKLVRGGAAALGALFEPDEAEAGRLKLPGGVRGRIAKATENWRLGDVADPSMPPPSGHNLPPTGSLNPLHDIDVTFRGKQPKDMSPEEMQAFGEHYGVKNLGTLSPLETFKDMSGNEFQIPGGLGGKWSYYDLLHMKANPINPSQIDRALHAEMQRKLGRTHTPDELTDAQVFNGLVFGMTSPNNPLFPNQVSASRLRLRTPEMINDLASMIPWKPGEEVPAATRKLANDQIAARFGLQSGEKGGLGTRGTADYSRVAEMAQMFRENPAFFRKGDNESWGQAVERIASQVPGLSMKTGSFGTVWQDPAHAGISAIDRHMARELDKRGGVFGSPEERTDWQNRSVGLWNKREAARVAEQEAENAKAIAKGKTVREVAPVDTAADFDDLLKKSGSDGFMGEMLLDHVGKELTPKFRTAKGEINPNIPQHLQQAQWVREPETVFKMGRAYKQALDVNQKIADENGLNLFMSQWMEWDRIRNRFEPHENMFPGLEKMPAPSLRQLREVDIAHKETGHKTYGKSDEGTLQPTRPLSGLPSRMGYLGIGGAAAMPGFGQLVRPDQYE